MRTLKKNQNGVTLTALVITIIVLAIIAGSTITLIISDGGIFDRAQMAIAKAKLSKIKEEVQTMYAGYQNLYDMAEFRGEEDLGTIVEYFDNKTGDGKQLDNYFIDIEDEDDIIVYVGDAVNIDKKLLTGKIEENGNITWIESKKEIPEGFEIGTIVTYEPTGKYQWNARYCSSVLDTTNDNNYTSYNSTGYYGLLDSSTNNFKISKWKVLSIDEYTGKVEMVPDVPTTGRVYLGEGQGYNNAVKLLNDACKALYSSDEIKARSINIKDIEKVMKFNPYTYKTNYANYGKQPTNPYEVNTKYPIIYGKEDLSVITTNGLTKEKKDMGFSLIEQNRLIERSESTSETTNIGAITTATSIHPAQTYYYLDNSQFTKALGEKYADIILPKGATTNYWVASRNVYTEADHCRFAVNYVTTGYIGGATIYYSNGNELKSFRPLFPVVTLNIDKIGGDSVQGFRVN